MLLRAGVVNELQLNAALAEQRKWGGKLGQILVRMGALSEDLLVMALARQLTVPRADLTQVQAIPDALRQRLDRAMCEKLRVLPLAYIAERKALQVAMSDPFDVRTLDELRMRLNLKIEPLLAGEQAILEAVRRTYGATSSMAMMQSDEGDFIDNSGKKMQTTPPSQNIRPQMPPQMAPQPAAVGQASFGERVSEYARTVDAVAQLLSDKGLGPRR
jgi:hypothetical protein